jgi:hypothetical protein
MTVLPFGTSPPRARRFLTPNRCLQNIPPATFHDLADTTMDVGTYHTLFFGILEVLRDQGLLICSCRSLTPPRSNYPAVRITL